MTTNIVRFSKFNLIQKQVLTKEEEEEANASHPWSDRIWISLMFVLISIAVFLVLVVVEIFVLNYQESDIDVDLETASTEINTFSDLLRSNDTLISKSNSIETVLADNVMFASLSEKIFTPIESNNCSLKSVTAAEDNVELLFLCPDLKTSENVIVALQITDGISDLFVKDSGEEPNYYPMVQTYVTFKYQ